MFHRHGCSSQRDQGQVQASAGTAGFHPFTTLTTSSFLLTEVETCYSIHSFHYYSFFQSRGFQRWQPEFCPHQQTHVDLLFWLLLSSERSWRPSLFFESLLSSCPLLPPSVALSFCLLFCPSSSGARRRETIRLAQPSPLEEDTASKIPKIRPLISFPFLSLAWLACWWDADRPACCLIQTRETCFIWKRKCG